MKNTIKVSFIIPAYNAGNVIIRCIESILNIESLSIEILVVDDGSTDDTFQKISNLMDERIILLHQKNKGVSQARNRGIDKARGEYIAFIDADDYVEPGVYQKIIADIDDNMDFIMFNYDIVYPDRIIMAKLPHHPGVYGQNDGRILCERLYDFPFSKRYNSQYIGGKVYQYLFRREFLRNHNISFAEGVHFAEDCIFCCACFWSVSLYKVIEDIPYHYVYTEDSASHKYREAFWEELLQAYTMGCEIYGKEFKHKNEVFFCYGDCVIQQCVRYGINRKDLSITIRKIKQMLNVEIFREAIENLTYDNWTLKEKVLIYLYKNRYYRFVCCFYIIIMVKRKLWGLI